MENSTCLGISALVDEIISDARQKMESGDLLPASEESSLSILRGGKPVARSTSIANIPGLRGYRSFTDDVLKSFMDKDGRFDAHAEKNDAEQTSGSDPFEGFSGNQQLESSLEFVSAEKLLNEFDEDAKRCQEENLFRENRPVPIECSSLAESPEKFSRKQVSPPDWAKNSPQLDSFSCFSEQPRSSVPNSDGTLRLTQSNLQENSDLKEAFSCFDPGLPYSLGIVLPGVSTAFDLPLSVCSRFKIFTESSLNGKTLPLCSSKLTDQYLNIIVTPPPRSCGEISIHIELAPDIDIKLSLFCIAPAFRLAPRICVPPGTSSVVPLQILSPFPTHLDLKIVSDFVKTREIKLTPEMDSCPLQLVALSTGTPLEITLLFRDQEFVTLSSVIEVRDLKISMQCRTEGSNSSLVLTNSEKFPVEVKLGDDSGCLSYSSLISIMEGQTITKSMKSFNMRPGQPERVVTFHLSLVSPVQVPLPCQCSCRFPSSLADLRPNLPRFLWLLDDEVVFSMLEHSTNEPRAWKERVSVSPCPLIEKYIKVVEDPSDPTKIILRTKKPSQLVFGRLKFHQRGPDGKAMGAPYGFRYPFLVPQKPQLRWHAVAENVANKIYQIPIDDKLRVTNTIAHDVFVVTPDQKVVLPGNESIELTIRQPCRVFYGLESWRQIVRTKVSSYMDQIENSPQTDLDPFLILSDFPAQKTAPMQKWQLDVIPSDSQSLMRLYKLFEGTVESITLQRPTANRTFFNR